MITLRRLLAAAGLAALTVSGTAHADTYISRDQQTSGLYHFQAYSYRCHLEVFPGAPLCVFLVHEWKFDHAMIADRWAEDPGHYNYHSVISEHVHATVVNAKGLGDTWSLRAGAVHEDGARISDASFIGPRIPRKYDYGETKGGLVESSGPCVTAHSFTDRDQQICKQNHIGTHYYQANAYVGAAIQLEQTPDLVDGHIGLGVGNLAWGMDGAGLPARSAPAGSPEAAYASARLAAAAFGGQEAGVTALVDGEELGRAAIAQVVLSEWAARYRAGRETSVAAITGDAAAVRRVVARAVVERLVALEAARSGLAVPDADVDALVAEQRRLVDGMRSADRARARALFGTDPTAAVLDDAALRTSIRALLLRQRFAATVVGHDPAAVRSWVAAAARRHAIGFGDAVGPMTPEALAGLTAG